MMCVLFVCDCQYVKVCALKRAGLSAVYYFRALFFFTFYVFLYLVMVHIEVSYVLQWEIYLELFSSFMYFPPLFRFSLDFHYLLHVDTGRHTIPSLGFIKFYTFTHTVIYVHTHISYSHGNTIFYKKKSFQAPHICTFLLN